jgi:hypothetical protein
MSDRLINPRAIPLILALIAVVAMIIYLRG